MIDLGNLETDISNKSVNDLVNEAPDGISPYLGSVVMSMVQGPTEQIKGYLEKVKARESGEMMSPDKVMEIYGLHDKPKEDISRGEADFLYERQLFKDRMQKAIDLAPDTLYSKAQTFVGGMVGTMLDPINFATGMAASKLLPFASSTARAIESGSKVNIAQRIAVSSADAVLGNVAADAIGYNVGNEIGDKYTSENFMDSVKFGIAFGVVGGTIGHFFNKVSPDTPKTNTLVNNAIENRFRSGLDPRSGYDIAAHAEANARFNGKLFDYTHDPGDIRSKVVYSTTDGNYKFKEAPAFRQYSDGFEGVHITDNPNVAHASGHILEDHGGGKVYTHDVSGINLLDANSTIIPDFLRGKIEEIYGKNLSGNPKLSEIFTDIKNAEADGALPDGTFKSVQKLIQDNGYGGVQFTADKFRGQDHAAHNTAVIFNKEDLTPNSRGKKANSRATGDYTQNKAKEVSGKVQKKAFSYKEDVSVAKKVDTVPVDEPTATIQHLISETDTHIKDLTEAVKFDEKALPEDIKVIDKIREDIKKIDNIKKLREQASYCAR